MAETIIEPAMEINDLEDGEIESDGDDTTENQNEEKKESEPIAVPKSVVDERQPPFYSKSGKKKKSKNNKSEQRYKEKSKKHRKYDNPAEDDFAGNIEKAIRKVLNKSDDNEQQSQDDSEERRKNKKRKKYDAKDSPGKKRRKQEYSDEMDESEMMCIRGASPIHKHSSPIDSYQDDNQDSYASDSSHDSKNHHSRGQRRRPHQRERKSKSDRDRRRGVHPMQDPDGVCLYYMQGKCHKGDDCIYSHDAQPPRKMELCKFYLMDCCAKRDKCLYMHSDFPCKYYHTGLPCMYKDECKFAHGKPLPETLKLILLKHIESAPKEILGDFPRLNREGAMMMIANTQAKLVQQFSSDHNDNQDKTIPSLFDLNVSKPENMPDSSAVPLNNFNKDKPNKVSPKVRQSRWQNDNTTLNFNNHNPSLNHGNTSDVLSIKNLTGVLTPRQISDLTKMGIENLDQLNHLSVLQLNTLGLTLKQINEIQLNALSIQKLGLINTNTETILGNQNFVNPISASKDLDLRVAPVVPVTNSSTVSVELAGKDVDMRFQSALSVTVQDGSNEESKTVQSLETQQSKDTIDIDQYTKDALKFASKEKHEDIQIVTYENDKQLNRNIPKEIKDTDHRVLQFPQSESLHDHHHISNTHKELDTDIRFLQPETFLKHAAKRNRRSTTDDDDDNNLLIDEKWYSSDEEKGNKKKSPLCSPRPPSPPQTEVQVPPVIEPAAVLSKLGDLSKFAISEEVTKLLNTMKNNLQENKMSEQSEANDIPKIPRSITKKSPEHKSVELKPQRKPSRPSIYECVEGEPTDGRRRSDVDLRHTDFKLPAFGDTDLRPNSSGDIDFRLGLPFKPIPNYTPASEINGSINCHPPIPYKLVTIDIPRPDYTDIRNSTAKSQALLDPRLRKVFRLSTEDSNSDSEKSIKISSVPRVDPRRKPKETNENTTSESKALDLQAILQNSNWYKDLSSTQKIFVNQHLATVTAMIKQHQQDKTPGKKFDVTIIQTNPVLCNLFMNLGISLNENAEFTYLPKPKEALLKTPMGFNQNITPFGMNNMGGVPRMDAGNMNVMNMPHMAMNNMNMNNVNMGHMPPLNPNFQDVRGGGPTPGLLGIAPNIPHNFDTSQFGGRNNFGNQFNGPGQGNMEGDQSYQRFSNRGGYRGRSNERWNRGGGGRGHRDRKNIDRGGGGWKK